MLNNRHDFVQYSRSAQDAQSVASRRQGLSKVLILRKPYEIS